ERSEYVPCRVRASCLGLRVSLGREAGFLTARGQVTNMTYIRNVSSYIGTQGHGVNDSKFQEGSLVGLRVLDLSRVLAGPLCCQMLGDHGAEVIKVEPPAGDDTRAWGPPFIKEGMSAYYNAINRNKANICLDLSGDRGQEVLGLL